MSIQQQKSASPNFAACVQSGVRFLAHRAVILFVYVQIVHVPHISTVLHAVLAAQGVGLNNYKKS